LQNPSGSITFVATAATVPTFDGQMPGYDGNGPIEGTVGHSMGGYGATRIGMKHADVFGSMYIFRIG